MQPLGYHPEASSVGWCYGGSLNMYQIKLEILAPLDYCQPSHQLYLIGNILLKFRSPSELPNIS